MFRVFWLLCLVVGGAACLTSCGGPSEPAKKACYPVKGQLFVASKPAAGAMVVLHPDEGTPEEWTAGYPRAQVQSDGAFDIETYGDKDGAPAGAYKVLVTWTQGDDGESEDTQMVDRLKGRYSDAGSSSLRVTVAAGPTELAPIRLP
jgi:hypothetical protein